MEASVFATGARAAVPGSAQVPQEGNTDSNYGTYLQPEQFPAYGGIPPTSAYQSQLPPTAPQQPFYGAPPLGYSYGNPPQQLPYGSYPQPLYGGPPPTAYPHHQVPIMNTEPRPYRYGEESPANMFNIPEDKLITEDLDIKIRHAFIRKVYGVLSLQLLITFGLAMVFLLLVPAQEFLIRNIWLMWVAMIGAFVAVMLLACIPTIARSFPVNYVFLGVISLCFGIVLGFASLTVSSESFVIAAGMTTAVTVALSIFACQTKYDFTGCGVFVFVSAIILLIFGIVAIFIRNRIVHIVYAALGTLVFSFYLVYDTQKIVGGKHRKFQFSIDDYAFGALALYMDIINLFLYILQLVAAARGER